jgi:hypothetical protein
VKDSISVKNALPVLFINRSVSGSGLDDWSGSGGRRDLTLGRDMVAVNGRSIQETGLNRRVDRLESEPLAAVQENSKLLGWYVDIRI